MCFRPGGAAQAIECPVCGKKVQMIGGVMMKKCPFCKTEIPDDATRCPHCTSELTKD